MAVEKDVKVPDIGGGSVDVIEILVKVGDEISIDTPLVTLESDKASMEIPSSVAGVVHAIRMKIGDKISEGDVMLTLTSSDDTSKASTEKAPSEATDAKEKDAAVAPKSEPKPDLKNHPEPVNATHDAPAVLDQTIRDSQDGDVVSAGPAARRLAHALGVDLAKVQGSGRKSRVSKEDIEQFVKVTLSGKMTGGGLSVASAPTIDFSKFGETHVLQLSKIKRLTGINVHRAWVTIPHVTQFDEADITDLEAFRKIEATAANNEGYKLTLLAFVCKVVSKALEVFPQFNASLDATGDNLIYKHYCHIGIAVETPNGLVVPVIKDVNLKSVKDIAKEMARLSTKARDKGLMPADMSGGCFTISSLGGIGGTAFTPIVNSPEVAILGLSRSSIKPVFSEGEFVPRLMLPLSLSYDHRVIDGAEGARFTCFVRDALSDIRRILL